MARGLLGRRGPLAALGRGAGECTVKLWAGAASLTVRDPDYSNNSDSEPIVLGVSVKK